jgi:hypothetical protein
MQSYFMPSGEPAVGLPWAGLRESKPRPPDYRPGLPAVAHLQYWVRYLKNFIASEYTNRDLMACGNHRPVRIQIAPTRQLAFHERRALVERFGCRLAPVDEAGFYRRPRVKSFEIRMNGKSYGSWVLLT